MGADDVGKMQHALDVVVGAPAVGSCDLFSEMRLAAHSLAAMGAPDLATPATILARATLPVLMAR